MRSNSWRRLLAACIVVAVGATAAWSTALAAPGDLDPTFSGDGIVPFVDTASGVFVPGDVVVDDAERVLVASTLSTPSVMGTSVVVRRFRANGAVDTSYSGDGRAVLTNPGGTIVVRDIALQPDGKLVLAGSIGNAAGADTRLAVFRLLPDGSYDTSFSGDGRAVLGTAVRSQARSIAVAPNGKIVVAGIRQGALQPSFPETTSAGGVVVRFRSNGGIDTAFASGGIASFEASPADPMATEELFTEVAISTSGAVVAAGRVYTPDPFGYEQVVARYLPTGAPDTNFDGGDVRFEGEPYDLAILHDGRALTVGQEQIGGTVALRRWLADGSLDPTFSGDGIAPITVSGFSTANEHPLVVQPDGHAVVVGGRFAGADLQARALRFTPAGTLDSTFGTNGVADIDTNSFTSYGWAAALAPSGKLVAHVSSSTGSAESVALVRLTGQTTTCRGHLATHVGTGSDDIIVGTLGDDVVTSLGGHDRIATGPGDDVVCAGTGHDRVNGGDGDDVLDGGAGDDILLGKAGRDILFGGLGTDVCGGGGNKDKANGCETVVSATPF